MFIPNNVLLSQDKTCSFFCKNIFSARQKHFSQKIA